MSGWFEWTPEEIAYMATDPSPMMEKARHLNCSRGTVYKLRRRMIEQGINVVGSRRRTASAMAAIEAYKESQNVSDD